MFLKLLVSGRYVVMAVVIAIFSVALALMLYQTVVIFSGIVQAVLEGNISPKASKVFAVGVIEAADIFLIGIVTYLVSLSLYWLFIDSTIPLPSWLRLKDLDDLKANLVSAVIVVLAVHFLREAISWDGQRDLLRFGTALALTIGVLTFYLAKPKSKPKDD